MPPAVNFLPPTRSWLTAAAVLDAGQGSCTRAVVKLIAHCTGVTHFWQVGLAESADTGCYGIKGLLCDGSSSRSSGGIMMLGSAAAVAAANSVILYRLAVMASRITLALTAGSWCR